MLVFINPFCVYEKRNYPIGMGQTYTCGNNVSSMIINSNHGNLLCRLGNWKLFSENCSKQMYL